MNTFWHDILYGARMLRKNPGFTIVAAATLSIGIAANSTIFSLVNAILLKPVPYKDSEHVVFVLGRSVKEDRVQFVTGLPDFVDWKEQNQVFDQMAAYVYWSVNLTGTDRPERLQGYAVTTDTFSLLGVPSMLGRTFLPEDGKPGATKVVVLNHNLWVRSFASDPHIIDQTLRLDGENYTVIGVMPPKFEFPQFNFAGDLWTPLPITPDQVTEKQRSLRVFVSIARLKPGVTVPQAQADLDIICQRLEQQHPDTNTGLGVKVITMQQMTIQPAQVAFMVLFVAVGLVLLIGCTNVANLLLARAVARKKEIAVRMALGARRSRLIRQLLTESVLLSLLGGGLGVLLAAIGIRVLRDNLSQIELVVSVMPSILEIGIDQGVLIFTLVISLLTGFVFGLAPALQSSKVDLNSTLKDAGRTSGAPDRNRLRRVLVVMQIGLALPLLVCVGLMIRSFLSVMSESLGFNPDNVLTMQVSLPKIKYPDDKDVNRFYKDVLTRVSALPAVESAAMVNVLPLSTMGEPAEFTIDGRPNPNPDEIQQVYLSAISPDYLRVMEIALARGESFTEFDTQDSRRVSIVNKALARRFFPNEDPIGKQVSITGMQDRETHSHVIVGVVEDIKQSSIALAPDPQLYVPLRQSPRLSVNLIVRTRSAPMTVAEVIRREIKAVDSEQPVFAIRTMQQIISMSLMTQKVPLSLMLVFGTMALLLAAVGVYGVMSYSVTQRKHELGIRMALGAQNSDVIKLIMKQGMALTLVGVVIGLAVAVALAQALRSVLVGVAPTDPITFLSASLAILLAALLATYFPALKATRVNPAATLDNA